ncbi:hypothetical protein FRC02_000980 [Tulasnella sp. 418]|nr:hypothetical protein FRC02_000980 [Tulasnella sp. 418]
MVIIKPGEPGFVDTHPPEAGNAQEAGDDNGSRYAHGEFDPHHHHHHHPPPYPHEHHYHHHPFWHGPSAPWHHHSHPRGFQPHHMRGGHSHHRGRGFGRGHHEPWQSRWHNLFHGRRGFPAHPPLTPPPPPPPYPFEHLPHFPGPHHMHPPFGPHMHMGPHAFPFDPRADWHFGGPFGHPWHSDEPEDESIADRFEELDLNENHSVPDHDRYYQRSESGSQKDSKTSETRSRRGHSV